MAGENTTTSFPKMGDDGIPHSIVNMSGNRSAYTTAVGRKTEGRGASPTGVKKNRGKSLIHEANGPQFRPTTTLYKANAASANDTQRNTKIMPAATRRSNGTGSAGDFWSKNAYGQSNG